MSGSIATIVATSRVVMAKSQIPNQNLKSPRVARHRPRRRQKQPHGAGQGDAAVWAGADAPARRAVARLGRSADRRRGRAGQATAAVAGRTCSLARDEHEAPRDRCEGLLAGLTAIAPQADAAYATSCDVPLLAPAFVRAMIDRLGDAEIAVPGRGRLCASAGGRLSDHACCPHIGSFSPPISSGQRSCSIASRRDPRFPSTNCEPPIRSSPRCAISIDRKTISRRSARRAMSPKRRLSLHSKRLIPDQKFARCPLAQQSQSSGK